MRTRWQRQQSRDGKFERPRLSWVCHGTQREWDSRRGVRYIVQPPPPVRYGVRDLGRQRFVVVDDT
jgi:hypothetical protein